MRHKSVLALIVLISLPGSAFAKDFNQFWLGAPLNVGRAGAADPAQLPPCEDDDGSPIEPNNDKVLAWKVSTPNHFLKRGYVVGTLVGLVLDNGSHLHLDVYVGEGSPDGSTRSDVEVIYNRSFGDIKNLPVGAVVAACGDYITSSSRWGRYPPSPMGAILHWVHQSNSPRHASGFLAIDGVVYGNQGDAQRGRGLNSGY